MIKLVIPGIITVAFFAACVNAPAQRIAECENHGESDGVCVAHEWNFDMESPFSATDLSTQVSHVIVQK